jgi:quinol monooxygenase YgiN
VGMPIDSGCEFERIVGMPIFTIAQYQIRPSGVEAVKRAIQGFVPYVKKNEAGTRLYLAWRQKDDPTRFVHFFIFENEDALAAHSESAAVKHSKRLPRRS